MVNVRQKRVAIAAPAAAAAATTAAFSALRAGGLVGHSFCRPNAPRVLAGRPSLALLSRSAGGTPANPRGLDAATVALHQKYHDGTINYVAERIDWVQSKGYAKDESLSPEEEALVAKAAVDRLRRWPQLDARDVHDAPLGDRPQRFCSEADGPEALGDPGDNVFVVSLARRPSRLKHALHQLWKAGVSATIVDAVDGDAIELQSEIKELGVEVMPGYDGHKSHGISLTTGEVGCFMSHYTIWKYMVDNQIPSAMILEDDFDFQEDFAQRLGQYLKEARHEPWDLMFIGRSPVEPDRRRVSEHIVEPGYTLWTVGYILRLSGARALLDANVQRVLAPLDDFFSVAMGAGMDREYNEQAPEWFRHMNVRLRGLAVTPPLVMPYVGSMILSDTAMLRKRTRYVKNLPV